MNCDFHLSDNLSAKDDHTPSSRKHDSSDIKVFKHFFKRSEGIHWPGKDILVMNQTP